jgi:Cysteine-rich CPXCG
MINNDPDLPEDLADAERPTDTEASVTCPYCGETVEIALDPGSGSVQDYIEDCQVCCQPWRVLVMYHRDGNADVELQKADDT